MSKDVLKLALSKIKSARDCHPNAVQELIFEAEELLEQALAAPVQEPVQNIEHCIWARNGNTPCPHTTPPAAQPATEESLAVRFKCTVVDEQNLNGIPLEQWGKQALQEPDWKSEYQNAVELHCMTLDELREADAWIKNLEKLMADQDVMLKRQTARIVDLQTHIENFDGEDR